MGDNAVKNNLIDLYTESFRENWDRLIFSDYEGADFTYSEAAQLISRLHLFFSECNIKPGDRIALLGRNSSRLGISFIAIIGYGAVAVPILPDFNPSDVHHIINHSGSKMLFAADQLFKSLDETRMTQLEYVLSLTDFSLLANTQGTAQKAWDKTLKKGVLHYLRTEDFSLKEIDSESMCVISYTSGTSGFTKGVMIPARSLFSNINFARDKMPLKGGDKIVSFLPMAHVFGLLFEFLFPVTLGCHITFLSKTPSPQIIINAFKKVQPHLILSVPLVIEKIYKKRILPSLEKPLMKLLLKIPVISTFLKQTIKAKLVETFGGRFHEIVIGGAPLSKEVESFFREIEFPFTIGYGMTECGPLISYDAWNTTQPGSAGKLVDRMMVKIDSENPYKQVGEILVKGEHVMLGYYKNEEDTSQAIDQDGWLHTGDLGVIDQNNYIFIRGRSKNMILGPSGQNIYPEEIEAKLANLPYVQECVVTDQKGLLVGLVFPDQESIAQEKPDHEGLVAIMEANRAKINKQLPRYSQLSQIILVEKEFKKTPKRNIKRYLYT